MAYQDLISKLRAAANSVNAGGTFINARRRDGSIEYNNNFPQIHNYNSFKTNRDLVKNFDAANLVMGFWYQDAPDSTNDERETISANADDLMTAFIADLQESGVMVTNMFYETNTRQLSATMSGMLVQFTATIKNNVCD